MDGVECIMVGHGVFIVEVGEAELIENV